MSKPKITILPPAEQDVFFQEQQFDEALGEGTNPLAYWRGQTPSQQSDPSILRGANKAKKSRLKKAEKALEGHENKEEIMKILRSE